MTGVRSMAVIALALGVIPLAECGEAPALARIESPQVAVKDGTVTGGFDYAYAEGNPFDDARLILEKEGLDIDMTYVADGPPVKDWVSGEKDDGLTTDQRNPFGAVEALHRLTKENKGRFTCSFSARYLESGEYTLSVKSAHADVLLGTFTISRHKAPTPAIVKTESRKHHMVLKINGKVTTPFFMSLVQTYVFPDRMSTYWALKKYYQAGIRLFVPIVSNSHVEDSRGRKIQPAGIQFHKDGRPDFRRMDALLFRMATVCPDAYFLLRLNIPLPPDFPDNERCMPSRRPVDNSDSTYVEDHNNPDAKHGASLASKTFYAYADKLIEEVTRHMRQQPYGERIIGLFITGVGYEGNGGFGGICDLNPQMTKDFATHLRTLYATEDDLRKAWKMPYVSWDAPPQPGYETLSCSTFKGFRDDSPGRARWIMDSLGFRGIPGRRVRKMFLDSAYRVAPNWWYRGFGGHHYNNHWGLPTGGGGGYSKNTLKLKNELNNPNGPVQAFRYGILCYNDRRAGGVSLHMDQAWETARLHNRFTMTEVDLRNPTYMKQAKVMGDTNIPDAVSSMRREFAHVLMIGRQAMWFFDMGWGAGWYWMPELMDELGNLSRLAPKIADLPQGKDTAETVVVGDTRSWSHFAMAPQPVRYGQKINFNKHLICDLALRCPEAMMRSGTDKKFIDRGDLFHSSMDSARLFIFQTSFYADQQFRDVMHERVRKGAVAYFCFGAGIVDEDGVTLENMEKLLKMKINYGDRELPLQAEWRPEDPLWSFALGPDRVIGSVLKRPGTRCRRPLIATWYRFSVEKDPSVIPLAYYEKSNEVAVAAKKMGKGWIVYSAVPVMQPEFYRGLSRIAGCHIYSEENDAVYASDQFIMIHTRQGGAGKKCLRLRKKTSNIVEPFTGKRIEGRNLSQIEVELTEKHTAAYYIGGDPDVAASLMSSDEAEP
ncbi:MAG: hypothetical protein K9N51_05320 [Candidatus Pacebacteria bacterium]|nr:hypothetical protein [Candidatus Paceibacterota bacterium]